MDKKILVMIIFIVIALVIGIIIFFLKNNSQNTDKEIERKLLGGMTPEEALEYMKTTENLVIIEVNTSEWRLSKGFTGAIWIPHTEIENRYNEIPSNRPVLLHCGAGVVSVAAYNILNEKRPDIPQLGYIAGAPPVREYNEWLENKE